MTIMVGVPPAFAEKIEQLFTVNRCIVHEGIHLFSVLRMGGMVLETLANEGIACNAMALMADPSKPEEIPWRMWTHMMRFDAIGQAIPQSPWLPDRVEYDIHMAKLGDRYFATLACAPSFCENQETYGRRYVLSKMLID